MRDNYWLAER